MRSIAKAVLVLSLLAALAARAHAGVLVVDGVGAAPGTYATIQAAVDDAVAGDTVLIHVAANTSAESVVVDGKAINLFIDTFDEQAVVKKFTVRNIPAGQVFSARGIQVVAPAGSEAMVFEDNPGTLRLYTVRAKGKLGQTVVTPGGPIRNGELGARFENCADVMLNECGFGGGDGGTVNQVIELEPSNGGTGAIIIDSVVAAFGTAFTGGDGGDVELLANESPGGNGGIGLVSTGSQVLCYGTGARGGPGGNAHSGGGGDGGTGLIQSGAGALHRHYLAPPTGGAGGDGFFGPVGDGAPGTDQVIEQGNVIAMSFTQTFAREMWTHTPVREGEAIAMTVTGFNDDAWLLYSFDPGHQVFPEYQGALMLDPPLSDLIYLGPVPVLAWTFALGTVPELPPGFDVVEIHVQVVMRVSGTSYNLINPDHIVLLDSAY